MSKYRAIFIFADYYDANTASRRSLLASKSLFKEVKFVYWARKGVSRESMDPIYNGIEKDVFLKTAKPRSLKVIWFFVYYQFWIFVKLMKYKPDFIQAFTFYTIVPSLFYKFFFRREVKIVYDPRDYVAVSYRFNKIISFFLKWLDNICMLLSNMTIFPDRQYFIHYGKFKLKEKKYFIMPNSSEDCYDEIQHVNLYEKYNIDRERPIIPIIGYFSEDRGKRILLKAMERFQDDIYFIVAGNFRDKNDLDFFSCHQNVIYLGNIPYKETLCIMKNSFIVPMLYNPALLNYKYAYPTKFYDCMMVGTPVLVSSGQEDVYKVVMRENVGYCITYDSYEELEQLICDIVLGQKKLDYSNARQLYLKKYEFNLIKENLFKRYEALLNG